MLRAGGLLTRVLEADRSLDVVLLSPMARDAAFVREFARDRVQIVDLPGHTPARTRGAPARDRAGELSQPRPDRIGSHPPRRGARQRHHPRAAASRRRSASCWSSRSRTTARATRCRIGWCRIPQMERLFDEHRPMLVVAANPGPGVLGSAAAAHGAAPRRLQHGDRSELGQLHQQADPGAAGRSAGGLERHHEGAGDGAARL